MDNISRGGWFALLAFICWGLFPLYFQLISSVPAIEMAAHRTSWVFATLWPVLVILGWNKRIKNVFVDWRAMKFTLCSSFLLSINWILFIWTMANGYVLQSSLAYYINPLVNILLGVVVLREYLRWAQWICVGLAGTGVLVMTIVLGEFPWIALSLAVTFGLYGLLRKQAPVDAMTGLFIETLLILPFAILYLIWLWSMGEPTISLQSGQVLYLVMASGVITSIPLVLFAEGAKRLPLSVLGFFQYIVPTGHFIIAVFVFQERFTQWHLLSFSLIWIALIMYTADALSHRKVTEIRING